MDAMEMARKLVNLSLDMDYIDYEDTIHDELVLIADDIEDLKEKDNLLYHLLEVIAEHTEVRDYISDMEEN